MRLIPIALLIVSLVGCQFERDVLPPATDARLSPPLINALGDTIVTGVEVKVLGKKRSIHEIMDLKVLPAGEPRIIPAHPNVHHASVVSSMVILDTVRSASVELPLPLVNSLGDTVPTGVPIPAIGKRIPVKWPEPIAALPPRSRDDATLDIKFMGVEQGLLSNSVTCVLKDRRGNFWIGTNGGGLTLYDGVSMWNFKREHGLPANGVHSLFEDKNGRIWIGTRRALMYYDGVDFVIFEESDGYANDFVMKILEDQSGNLWFGSWEFGLVKYDGESFTHYYDREGLQTKRINYLLDDVDGGIWVTSSNGGLFKFDGEGFTGYEFRNSKGEKSSLPAVSRDVHGDLWFGLDWGLCRYDGRQFDLYTSGAVSSPRVITEDREGNIWFVNGRQGVAMFDGLRFTTIGIAQGLTKNTIFDMFMDEDGKVWMSTYGGVNIYDPGSFRHPGIFSDATVKSLYQDSRGHIWFGVEGDGVYQYDGEQYYHFSERQGFFKQLATTWAMTEDQAGNMWFSSNLGQGWIRYSPPDQTHRNGTICHYYPKNDSVAWVYRFVNSLVADDHGGVWIGSEGGGLMRLQGDDFHEYTTDEGLISNRMVPRLIKDQIGDLWFWSDNGGITRFSPGSNPSDSATVVHFSAEEGLTSEAIHSVYPDAEGYLWLGDKAGHVYRYRADSPMRFHRLPLEQLRASEQVESFLRDPTGNLWLSTHQGLDRLRMADGEDPGSTLSVTTYKGLDGLKGLNFYRPALLDHRGRMWWSHDRGITELSTAHASSSVKSVGIKLSEVAVNGDFLDYRSARNTLPEGLTFDSVRSFSNLPLSLEMPYELNSISFHFAGQDWAAPNHIQYSYVLEGLSEEWSHYDKVSTATFQRVPPGDYTFKVRARGINGNYSESLSYAFVIRPAWWLTWWARGLYGLMTALVIVGIIRLRTNNLKRQRKNLEAIVHERTTALQGTIKQLQEAQSQLVHSEKMASLGQLTAGIAHEINNPINFVHMSSDAMEQDIHDLLRLVEMYRDQVHAGKGDPDKIKAFEVEIDYQGLITALRREVTDIHEGSRRTSEIVQSLGEFSRGMQSPEEHSDIHHGIDSTLSLLRSRTKEGVAIEKHYDPLVEPVLCNPGQLNQVFMNLLTNAMDAAGPNGTIQIVTKNAGKDVWISVIDDGPGIPIEVIDKIFDPFFTTKEAGEGTGLGLSISNKIIADHGGTITAKNNKNRGAAFTVRLPIRQ